MKELVALILLAGAALLLRNDLREDRPQSKPQIVTFQGVLK